MDFLLPEASSVELVPLGRRTSKVKEGCDGPETIGKALFHVLKLYNLPPLFPTLFSTAPQNEGDLPLIAQNARIAFCGNGFIHLNIAEIYEDIIGGQKRCAPIANQS